jgi:hypothetical protein
MQGAGREWHGDTPSLGQARYGGCSRLAWHTISIDQTPCTQVVHDELVQHTVEADAPRRNLQHRAQTTRAKARPLN